jgi:hypothetical protein
MSGRPNGVTDLSLSAPDLRAARTVPPAAAIDPLPALFGAALLIGLGCRLFSGLNAPLWFDETFSAEIASQTDMAHLIRWCLGELSGPVYYGSLFLWEKIAGNGDIALRIPSLAASIATPLLILWRGHADVRVLLIWAAIMALCPFTFETATQARPYALLNLLATAQAIAFIGMIGRPTRRSTLLWTSVSALMVLTHYHAAVICGFQGIAYLAICRMRAIRTWPALVPLVPMAIWMAFHLPMLLRFASKDTVWYGLSGPDALWTIPWLLTGQRWAGALLLAAMFTSFLLDGHAAIGRRRPWPYTAGETAAVIGGWASVAVVMGIGFVVPSFSNRYLLPYAPVLLLGIALWTRHMMRFTPLAAAPLLCLMLGSAVSQLGAYVRNPHDDFRYAFNFEAPSRWLAAQGVRRLVLLWDNPTASLPDPDGHIAAVGSFFLRRAQVPVDTIVPSWPRAGNPNLILTNLAGRRRDTAILWAYDASVPGTRGGVHPWRIPRIDPLWQCRDFGRPPIAVLTCVRRG